MKTSWLWRHENVTVVMSSKRHGMTSLKRQSMTSSKRHGCDVIKTSWCDIIKTSRCDVMKMFLGYLQKSSWMRWHKCPTVYLSNCQLKGSYHQSKFPITGLSLSSEKVFIVEQRFVTRRLIFGQKCYKEMFPLFQSRFKIVLNTKYTLKIQSIFSKKLPLRQNLVKSGHTGWERHWTEEKIEAREINVPSSHSELSDNCLQTVLAYF